MVFDLNPIAFQIGPFIIRWYGIFMALSFAAGAWYMYNEARKRNIDEDFLLNLTILIVIFGIAGARLMFVLINYPQWFLNDPIQILKIYQGGIAWHGGLLGGILVGWWYTKQKGVNFNFLADLAVPGLAVGYFMIRIANIFNQEILGRQTDFWFGQWPAQPIGSVIGLFLLARYFYLKKRNLPGGYQFWSFIFYHQLLRGAVEETIRDNPLVLGNYIIPHWGLGFFTLAQISTPFIMAFAYWMMRKSSLEKQKINFDDHDLLPLAP